MIDFFRELFNYNYHCNQKLSEAINNSAQQTSEKAIELFSHILNAHEIWNSRIHLRQQSYTVWQVHPVNELKEIDRVNYEQTLLILDKVDLEQRINYSTSKGQPFQNTVRDILFHVINHGTYHRGQIATEFRQAGLLPLSTDYVFYKR